MAQATPSGVSTEPTHNLIPSDSAARSIAIVTRGQPAEGRDARNTACTANEEGNSESDAAEKAVEKPRFSDEQSSSIIASPNKARDASEAEADGLESLSKPLSEMMAALSLVVEGELQAHTTPSYQRLTHLNLEASADAERLADLAVGVGVFVRCQLAARAATLRQLVAEAEEAERQLADLEGVVVELDRFTGKLERAVAKAIREGV